MSPRSLRRARVLCNGTLAGELSESPEGFRFQYDPAYLLDSRARPVSWTLPRRAVAYESRSLFAFFDGLLAEGTLADIQCRTLRIDPDDRFGRLLRTAHGDTIGCVTVEPLP